MKLEKHIFNFDIYNIVLFTYYIFALRKMKVVPSSSDPVQYTNKIL